jgi:hypothetical protein
MPSDQRNVLIVSPHFAPINAPDMQRTRLALPYLRSRHWEPVVVAVAPALVEGGVIEPHLELTYPADIRIIRVGGISPRISRLIGVGSLWLRCGAALRAAAERLLHSEKFDLIFFSTTQFDAFTLGPIWKRKFGIPYVIDYQDPWINDYYERTRTKPPGGRLKFGFSQWCARRREPRVLREASGVVAVSDSYGANLARHYGWFNAADVTILPFGASKEDFVAARLHKPDNSLIQFGDEYRHLVYTGRCGPDMSTSLSILFRAFKIYLSAKPSEANKIRFHFIGTDYAPKPFGRDWAMPVAVQEGVEKFVLEHCYRVPYFDALYYLLHADALIAVGSNDPTYSASKIFPYVLAERPMLLIFNHLSPVIAIANEVDCGARYAFRDSGDIERLSQLIAEEWFLKGSMERKVEINQSAFLKYTADAMTGRLSACFDRAVELHAQPA